jgi:hypothetical protein
MKAKGTVTFGGAAGYGAVMVDITLEDGRQYHYTGHMGQIGSPNVGHGKDFQGDFPGLSHILGKCAVEIVAGGVGAGGAQMTFFDLQGQIGTLVGSVLGGGCIVRHRRW